MSAIDVGEHLRLARHVANRFCRRLTLCAADRDDAQQEAMIGLLLAARDYRPEHPKANWRSFATARILWQLYRWLHAKPLIHAPRDSREPPALVEPLDERRLLRFHEPDVDAGLVREEMRAALGELPIRWRRTLDCRYGVDGESLATIAAKEGRSRQAVHKQEQSALARLRELLGGG